MVNTPKNLLLLASMIMGVGVSHAAPTSQKRDIVLGQALWLQPNGAKINEPIKKEGAPFAQALTNPNDKNEVQKKKLTITGIPGNYSLGYVVDFTLTNNVFPSGHKSIYVLSGYGANPDKLTTVGADIMLPDCPPVNVLNAPWKQIREFTKTTSCVKVVQLKRGMNFVSIKLDPANKISEFEKPASKDGKEFPMVKLEDNNNAVFAIEVRRPFYLGN